MQRWVTTILPRILIIEDDPAIARLLELELTHEGYSVTISSNGIAGIREMEEGDYQLILLDLMLPGINGMEVCRRVRRSSNIPIIMLTARDQVMDRVSGLDAGADDYITKPFATEELLARIRAVLRRQASKEKERLEIGGLMLNVAERTVYRFGQNIDLTRREFDLLKYLMENHDRVLSREQIVEAVWGYDYVGDSNVVDVYIKYLRDKIDSPFPGKLIHTVRGVGYVLREVRG